MAVFMNGNDLVGTIERIRAEMRTKRSLGRPNKADDDYMGCITMLQSCLSTGEMSVDQRERVENAIAEFQRHVDLGIIVNGRFSPVSPSQAARWDLVAHGVINMFPVVTKDEAKRLLFQKTLDTDDWRWDRETTSLVTKAAFYRRHPSHLMEISEKAAEEIGLLDQHRHISLVIASRMKEHVASFDF